jgi:hypothetical protein
MQPKVPVFTKKETATLAQRIEVMDWFHANGKNQRKTVKHFSTIYPNIKLTQPRVSDWLKGRRTMACRVLEVLRLCIDNETCLAD